MIDRSTCPAVERDPGVVSGAWVFRGTRVPVAALFENLEDGATVHDFLAWFRGVTSEQMRAVLDQAARSALATAQVRVLFDRGTPAPLRAALTGHVIETAYELGWSTLRNGELIAAAEKAGFEVFVATGPGHHAHGPDLPAQPPSVENSSSRTMCSRSRTSRA